jgi:predicted nucleic acid-binding protein
MVKALFDTNVLIDFLNGNVEAKAELRRFPEGAISLVTWMEVLAGATDDTAEAILNFLESFECRQITRPIAENAALLRRRKRLKLPDAIIWATAQVEGYLLITRNTRDFPSGTAGIRIPYEM